MTSVSIVDDDYSPLCQGDTGRPFAPVFVMKNPDGTWGPFNLLGATLSMKMQSATFPANIIVCTGLWTIDNASAGQAHYQWQSSDVATPDDWNLYITISIGGLPVHAITKPLQILPAP